jgi:kinesin family protein 18/19
MIDCGGVVPCLLNEITSPAKASMVRCLSPSKVSRAEDAADGKKEGCASRPRDAKKTKR